MNEAKQWTLPAGGKWWRLYAARTDAGRLFVGYAWAPSKEAAEAAGHAAGLGDGARLCAVPGPEDAPPPELVTFAKGARR